MSRPTQQIENSGPGDVSSADTIRALFSRYIAEPPSSTYRQWQDELTSFLEWVAKASPSERASLEFQHRLWDENKVSAVGRGSIAVDAALENLEFREWLAQASLAPVPSHRDEALTHLDGIYREFLGGHLKTGHMKRRPGQGFYSFSVR